MSIPQRYGEIHIEGSRITPWVGDDAFLRTFNQLDGRTMVDLHRLWGLWVAVKESMKLNRGHIAEVGCWRGGSAAMMARAITTGFPLGHWGNTLFVIDSFRGIVGAQPGHDTHRDGEFASGQCDVEKFIHEFVPEVYSVILKMEFPIRPGDDGELLCGVDGFRLVHCDVDTYAGTLGVLDYFAPKMNPGASIIVDDYGFESCRGAAEAVHRFRMEHSDFIYWYNLTGQAILTKIP